VERTGDEARLRILFASEPDDERTVRERIDAALTGGEMDGPDGDRTRWELRASGPGSVRTDETAHAERLIHG
jgi:hypothetical protein